MSLLVDFSKLRNDLKKKLKDYKLKKGRSFDPVLGCYILDTICVMGEEKPDPNLVAEIIKSFKKNGFVPYGYDEDEYDDGKIKCPNWTESVAMFVISSMDLEKYFQAVTADHEQFVKKKIQWLLDNQYKEDEAHADFGGWALGDKILGEKGVGTYLFPTYCSFYALDYFRRSRFCSNPEEINAALKRAVRWFMTNIRKDNTNGYVFWPLNTYAEGQDQEDPYSTLCALELLDDAIKNNLIDSTQLDSEEYKSWLELGVQGVLKKIEQKDPETDYVVSYPLKPYYKPKGVKIRSHFVLNDNSFPISCLATYFLMDYHKIQSRDDPALQDLIRKKTKDVEESINSDFTVCQTLAECIKAYPHFFGTVTEQTTEINRLLRDIQTMESEAYALTKETNSMIKEIYKLLKSGYASPNTKS